MIHSIIHVEIYRENLKRAYTCVACALLKKKELNKINSSIILFPSFLATIIIFYFFLFLSLHFEYLIAPFCSSSIKWKENVYK